MTTIIDMVEQNNARLIAQNPTTAQITDRLNEVTEELGGAYRTIDRLRDECRRALAERDEALRSRDLVEHEMCDADLEAQKHATWNARVGEAIAAVAAVVFAAIVIAQAFN